MASAGDIKSAPAVIPTNPPRTPFMNIVISKVPYTNLAVNAQAIPPAAAAKHVVTKVRDVNAGSADNTEPPLNPNHPNHRISTPAAERGRFEPGIASGFPS